MQKTVCALRRFTRWRDGKSADGSNLHGGGRCLFMGKEGTGCSLHVEGPLQSPFDNWLGLGKGALKWAPVWGGRAWCSRRPGRRDSSKGSKVGWDLVARAPPLIPHIRCVRRGASERSPEGWNPGALCGRAGLFLPPNAALPLGPSGPSWAYRHLLLCPCFLLLQDLGKAPAPRLSAPR